MKIELDILDRPIESELRRKDTTSSSSCLTYFFIVFLLYIMSSTIGENYSILKMILVAFFIIFLLFKPRSKIFMALLEEHKIGKLRLENDRLTIKLNSKENIISTEYGLKMIFRYGGAFEETESGQEEDVHYGTDNVIRVEEGRQTNDYYVFLDDTTGKEDFYNLVKWAYEKNIVVEEYIKGGEPN